MYWFQCYLLPWLPQLLFSIILPLTFSCSCHSHSLSINLSCSTYAVPVEFCYILSRSVFDFCDLGNCTAGLLNVQPQSELNHGPLCGCHLFWARRTETKGTKPVERTDRTKPSFITSILNMPLWPQGQGRQVEIQTILETGSSPLVWGFLFDFYF